MLKKTVTVLTFLLLIIGLIAFPIFSASIAKGQEELKIKDTLYQYFDSKYKALGSLTEVSYKYYYDSSNEDMDLNQESVNADIGFRKKLPDDYGYAYTTSWSNLAPGDICQLLWSDGTAKHSMIIVARVTDPILGTLKDYLIDCHSTDQKRYPLSLYTDPKVYFKIAGYY